MLNPEEYSGAPSQFVAVKDTSLVYRACSEAFARLLGFNSPSEIIGHDDRQLLSQTLFKQQFAHDSHTMIGGEVDVSAIVLAGQKLAIVRTPIIAPDGTARGIDIKLVGINGAAIRLPPATPEQLADGFTGTAPVAYAAQASVSGTASPSVSSERDIDKFRLLIDQGLEGKLIVQAGQVVFANQVAVKMFRRQLSDLNRGGTYLTDILSTDNLEVIKHLLGSKNTNPRANVGKLQVKVAGDRQLSLAVKALEVQWQSQPALMISLVETLSMEQSNPQLALREQRFRHYARASADFFWELDANLVFSFVSEDCEAAIGLKASSVVGRAHQDLVNMTLSANEEGHWDPQLTRLNNHQPFRDFEFCWNSKTEKKMVRYSGIPIYNSRHQFMGYRGSGRDVTAANAQAESVAYYATHDALTGLVNRRHFETLCSRALEKSRSDRTAHALCFLDLDNFKIVNDTCGHLAGDELLRQLSALLDNLVRKSDVLARLGGDEFGVFLYNCSVAVALKLANQIRSEVEGFQFLWEDNRFQVGVSVGLVIVDDRWNDLEALFSAADSACYLAKNEGRNRVVVYREGDGHASNRKAETKWADVIEQALDDNRLVIARQAIVAPGRHSDGERYEILARIRTENGELINPRAFLPSAERYGLSARLDATVIDLVLKWLKNNPRQLHATKLCSINLASGSFASEEFADALVAHISVSGIPASRLCFELTETATIANLSAASRFMYKLNSIGCHFMLDDFGSGLSSFDYLKKLPVDYLKIDGLLMKDILIDPIDFTMVKAINEISKSLGLKTIAEFIETPELLEAAREIGVDFVQGYQIGHPVVIDTTTTETLSSANTPSSDNTTANHPRKHPGTETLAR